MGILDDISTFAMENQDPIGMQFKQNPEEDILAAVAKAQTSEVERPPKKMSTWEKIDYPFQVAGDVGNLIGQTFVWPLAQIGKFGEIAAQGILNAPRALTGMPVMSNQELADAGRRIEQKIMGLIPPPVTNVGKYLEEKISDEMEPIMEAAHLAAENTPKEWPIVKTVIELIGDIEAFKLMGGHEGAREIKLRQASQFLDAVHKMDFKKANSEALNVLHELNIKPEEVIDPIYRREKAVDYVENIRRTQNDKARIEAIDRLLKHGVEKAQKEILPEAQRILDLGKSEPPKTSTQAPLTSGVKAKTAQEIMAEQIAAGGAPIVPQEPPVEAPVEPSVTAPQPEPLPILKRDLPKSARKIIEIAQQAKERRPKPTSVQPVNKERKAPVDEPGIEKAEELLARQKEPEVSKEISGETPKLSDVTKTTKKKKSFVLETDLKRLPVWVEEHLRPLYKRMKSGDLKRPKRMHRIAEAVIDDGKITDPGLAKTFRDWYNEKVAEIRELEKIDAKTEARFQEEDIAAGRQRVDPEVGRAPGVEAPKKKFSTGPDEITMAWEQARKPLTYIGEDGTTKIAKSQFLAMKIKKEQGLVGELVKDPKSEGWLVKMTKEQQKAHDEQLKKFWEEQLKEDLVEEVDRDLGPDLISLEDIDSAELAFDPWGNERGSIAPDVFLRPFLETGKIAAKGIKEFRDLINRHRERAGKDLITKEELSLKDLTPEERQNLNYVINEAKKEKTSIADYLMKTQGISRESAAVIEKLAWANKIPDNVKRTEMRKSPEKTAENGKRFVQSLNEDVNKYKEMSAISGFNQYLKDKLRIVDDYVRGSLESPDYQQALIYPEPVKIKEGVKDIRGESTWWRSPHMIVNKLFDVMSNPVIDYFESYMSYSRNISNHKKWAKEMTDGVPSAAEAINKAMEPGVKKAQKYIDQLDELMREKRHQEKLWQMTKKGEYKKTLDKVKLRISGVQKKINNILTPHYDSVIKKLAEKQPSVRIVLHAADELPSGIKLTMQEWERSNSLRKYFEKTKEELDKVGIATREGSYMPGIWKELIGEDQKLFDAIFDKKKMPSILSFKHKIPNSRTWYPDLATILDTYIPMASRKIAYQPFLNRWKYPMDVTLPPKARKYLTQWFEKNYYGDSLTAIDKVVNTAVAWEYFRLIGFAPSVAFKHALKVMGTSTIYGPLSTAKAIPVTAKIPVQAAMKALGVEGPKEELALYNSYVNMNSLIKMLDETPGAAHGILDGAKLIASAPTQMIEALDNGVSVLTSIQKGMKADVPLDVLQREVWQTILDANFRSGPDAPLPYKRPLVRLSAMFLMTPYKLAEFKYKLLVNAMKDPFGKDNFGTSNGRKLLNMALMYGVAETIARANDTSIMDQLIHLPGISHLIEGTSEFPYFKPGHPTVHGGPLLKTLTGQDPLSIAKERVNFPQMTKLWKISQGKYNRSYYNSPLGYFFGVQKLDQRHGKKSSGFGSFKF